MKDIFCIKRKSYDESKDVERGIFKDKIINKGEIGKMQTNYNAIKTQLRKFSFEVFGGNDTLVQLLDRLQELHPERIKNAKKPNLLAASLVYLYLKKARLNGKSGITAKEIGEYFDVKASAISAKTADVEFWLFGLDDDEPYEFIDKDRFEVNELYWEFLESEASEDIAKSIKILRSIIKKDPNYFDPYITLHEYYLANDEGEKAFDILSLGYERAMKLIVHNDKFPDILRWGFMENRHIIRILFNFAIAQWFLGEKKQALDLMLLLLHSNPEDNIGARYSIVAILEGYASQEDFEEEFSDGEYLDWEKQDTWFFEKAKKHKNVLGWWFEMEEEE